MSAAPSRADAAPEPAATCTVCGGPLSETVSGCGTCPVSSGCRMLCCANCGYQTVAPRSVIVDALARLLGRRRRTP